MKSFNNQFATQKLRKEMSVTGTGATFTPGTGEQMATNKAFKKKAKKEVKDVEPKLAAGKAKVYMKDKWGWTDAPSIPNRPSKGGFIYKQLFEELSNSINKEKEFKVGDKVKWNNLDWEIEKVLQDGDLYRLKSLKGDPSINVSHNVLKRVNEVNEINGKIHIGTDTKTDSDIYFEPKTGAFYINIIDPAGNRTNKLQVNTIEDVLSKFPNFKWTKEGEIEFQPEEQDDDEDKYDWFTDKYIKEINESYSKFKTETKTRGKSDQFHQAVREVRKKVQEINRLFEYVSRLKSELSEGEGGLKYKVHTEKALEKIKEMVAQLNQNVKKFK